MDFEKFISCIRFHQPLWRKTNNNNSICNSTTIQRLEIEKIWDGIATEMNTTRLECKKKWKYLKYHHRKALRKHPQQPGSPVTEALKHTFKYAENMAFMIYDDECGNEEYIPNSEDELLDYEDSCRESQSRSPKNITPHKRNPDTQDEMEIENKKLKLLLEDVAIDKKMDQECGHLLFFKSLIPFIQHLSPVETLSMRGEIQQVVLKYVAEKHENNNGFDQDPLN